MCINVYVCIVHEQQTHNTQNMQRCLSCKIHGCLSQYTTFGHSNVLQGNHSNT